MRSYNTGTPPSGEQQRYSLNSCNKIVKFRFPIIRNERELPCSSEASIHSPAAVLFRGGRRHRERVKMMESEILKFICANQGAVNTDYLVFNLSCGDSTSVLQIIRNQEKFASCCPFGQPKVVVRTRLRLCRTKDCQGSCRGLHLCKNFLFSGSCHFTRLR